MARQRGATNKRKQAFRDRLDAYARSRGVDPHFYMIDLLADEDAPRDLRFQAAKELAQYKEPKLRAVEHSGDPENPVMVLSPEQRQNRIAALMDRLPPERAAAIKAALAHEPVIEVIEDAPNGV